MISHVSDEDFSREVLMERGLVVVDFYAEWCMPCKMMHRVLEKISYRNDEVKIVDIDIEENPMISSRYEISNLPTLMFFKGGMPIDEIIGFVPEEYIEDTIEENL